MAPTLDLKTVTEAELSDSDRELYRKAREMTSRSYAVYSHFHVGAALRTQLGGVFAGCNVENGSYGVTICAERSAVFAAVASEGPEMRVREIAIYGAMFEADGTQTPGLVVSPCGACRQVLAELGPGARVIFPSADRIAIATVEALQPVAFALAPPARP